MTGNWTFGQKVSASIGLLVALTVMIGFIAFAALRTVVTAKDRVIDVEAQLLIDAQLVRALAERKGGEGRGFLLTRDERFLDSMRASRTQLLSVIERLQQTGVADDRRQLVDAIVAAEAEHQGTYEVVIARRRSASASEDIASAFDDQIAPARAALDAALDAFIAREEQRLRAAKQLSTDQAGAATMTMGVLVAIVVLSAMILGAVLIRVLRSQIGTAVSQVQSSSAELQSAATQQAAGAREQATAMNEIATTISELLMTSRQITESARRVAQIADDTAAAARSGGDTVDQAHESIAAIRRQVDLIVSHMLELGKKSQQIGTVLEIVSELAEQTNILAINATIEAAGAGEAGNRFAVVADEIRKLADRVAGSTKEIRGLIDDVRSSVNTTVMATETGSKSVDAGSKQFSAVATSFKQIIGLVTTTTDAAREIELSIKQQMTAVEQVNVAVTNIAQATKETETSTGQTQQTASQLALLSKDLLKVIRPEHAA